jgi:hypothetical protein
MIVAYRNNRKKDYIQEQQQEKLVQTSISSIYYRLTRRNTDHATSRTFQRTRYLLSRPTRKARKDAFYWLGYASSVGRHEHVPAALARHGTDIRAHLCQGGMIYVRTLWLGHACQSRLRFVQAWHIYNLIVGGRTRDTRAGEENIKDF